MRASTARSGMRLGMKLLLDPGIDAILHHGIDIARPRPEREPVEHMQRTLAIGEFVVGRLRR